ncbi:MAG: sensor histidine kinase [Gemmatimonadales bacterium]
MVRAFAPSSRSLRAPLLATGLFAVAYAALIGSLPPAALLPVHLAAMLGTNGFALWCFLDRAKTAPAERTGWRMFALGTISMVVANSIGLLAGTAPAHAATLRWVNLAFVLLAGIVQAQAVLTWSWRREEETSVWLHVVGSLIFACSLGVLFWLFGSWEAGFRGGPGGDDATALTALMRVVITSAAARTVLLGGVVVFLISEEPRRIDGPLGTFLVAIAVVTLAAVGVTRALAQAGAPTAVSPWFAIGQVYPILLGLAAWRRVPVEVREESPAARELPTQGIQYVPFLVVGGLVAVATVGENPRLASVILAFVAITGLLALRQVLLYRAVKSANLQLEARVRERTQRLEELQAVMLRTERLNTLATVGAGLTHDLNNFLSVIGASAELVQAEMASGKAPNPEDVANIVRATAQSARLTEKLMAFAREGTGTPVLVDLCAAVAALEELLRALLPRTIGLHLDLEGVGGVVLIPPMLLEQVLVNLVVNARDAMPRGGDLTVRVPPVDPVSAARIALEVTDNGRGIAPEIQSRVFDPFFTTKAEKGTGIGLASIRALMDSIGGTVAVASPPGSGATFRLEFPLNSVRVRNTDSEVSRSRPQRPLGRRVSA